MPSGDSHSLKTTRRYQGQASAEYLVNWLNHTKDTEGRQRILDLIRDYQALVAAVASTYDNTAHGTKDTGTRTPSSTAKQEPTAKQKPKSARVGSKALLRSRADVERVHQMEKAFEKRLEFYQTVPGIRVSLYYREDDEVVSDTTVGFRSRPAPGSALEQHLHNPHRINWKLDREYPGSQMLEISAFDAVKELAGDGVLHKLVECSCKQYLFSKFAHQKFCSKTCQMESFQTSPGAREKRNEYQRTLYHLRKAGKVR